MSRSLRSVTPCFCVVCWLASFGVSPTVLGQQLAEGPIAAVDDAGLFEDSHGFSATAVPPPESTAPLPARHLPALFSPEEREPLPLDQPPREAKPIDVQAVDAPLDRDDQSIRPVQFVDEGSVLAPAEEELPAPPPTGSLPIGLSTIREALVEVREGTLGEALDFLAEDSQSSFLLSEKASMIGGVALRLQNVSPREAFEALVTKYALDYYTSAGGRLIHVRVADEVVANVSDPGYRDRLRRLYQQIEGEINQTFPNSAVRLSLVGDQVVVRGEANDIVEAEQIITLVTRNAAPPPTTGGIAGLEGEGGASGLAGLTGLTAQLTEQLFSPAGGATRSLTGPADALLGEDLTADPPRVVNLLRVVGEQQVTLRVTVAEVNRSAARSIGLSFNVQNSDGADVFSSLFDGLGSISTDMMNPGFVAGPSANLPAALDNGQISLAINALRQLNLARTLAEPNLTALNGRRATFEAGGKFPVPVVAANAADGLQGVRFEKFGITLEFVPFILDRDRIRLNVAAGVSVRNPDLGANVGGSQEAGGTEVPGIDNRSFETTVELREGQTLAVAGLLQNEYVADADRVPGWGDLPLLGRTGAFDRSGSREQELVILITPELVHPLEAEEPMPLPGNDIFEPSDIEFYLHGRLESRRAEDFRAGARTDLERQASYEHCEDRVLIGPRGYSCGCGDVCPSCSH